MRVLASIMLIGLISSVSFSQSAKTKDLLKEIEGQWSLDDNNNVTYTHIVEVPELTFEEIYNRGLNYFVYNYGSGKSVIQSEDKDLGRILAKGLYNDVHVGISLVATYVDCWHVVRLDVKEGRARIILTLTDYEKTVYYDDDAPPSYFSMSVADEYPVNPKGKTKTVMGKAFYKSHYAAISTIIGIEEAIIGGNTSDEIENDDW